MKIKSTIAFTEKEYEVFNKVCMMLDDLINGDLRETFASVMDADEEKLDILYEMFADVVNYVEEHRE